MEAHFEPPGPKKEILMTTATAPSKSFHEVDCVLAESDSKLDAMLTALGISKQDAEKLIHSQGSILSGLNSG